MQARSESLDSWVVGIDDTDMPGIGGTGRLARRLAAEALALALGHSTGVTRHQFYEGPGVPKTARNSGAAIAFDHVASPPELYAMVQLIVARDSIEGSDPGVAMSRRPVSARMVDYARRAQTGLVGQAEARLLGAGLAAGLVGLGGTEDGVIGALGALALRLNGHDGRFVDLPGIRDVRGMMTVAEVLEQTGIADVIDAGERRSLGAASRLELGEWVRPRLIGGKPVLVARRYEGKWVNADTRSK